MTSPLQYTADLPDTDNPDVMAQAVSIYLLGIIWEEHLRMIDPENVEEQALELYTRVYKSVKAAHG